jgi:hypothetical protein
MAWLIDRSVGLGLGLGNTPFIYEIETRRTCRGVILPPKKYLINYIFTGNLDLQGALLIPRNWLIDRSVGLGLGRGLKQKQKYCALSTSTIY